MRRWWSALFASSNAALATLFVHHVLELVIERHESPTRFYVQHPWFLFTAVVSMMLSLGHIVLMIAPRCGATPRCINTPTARKRAKVMFFSLDGAWALLWVLQLTVQSLLPKEHRAYSLEAVAAMMVLYAAQAAFSVPLVYYLYVDCRTVDSAVPEAVCAAVPVPVPALVRVHTPVQWLPAHRNVAT